MKKASDYRKRYRDDISFRLKEQRRSREKQRRNRMNRDMNPLGWRDLDILKDGLFYASQICGVAGLIPKQFRNLVEWGVIPNVPITNRGRRYSMKQFLLILKGVALFKVRPEMFHTNRALDLEGLTKFLHSRWVGGDDSERPRSIQQPPYRQDHIYTTNPQIFRKAVLP